MEEDLPRAHIKRIVKAKLAELSAVVPEGDKRKEVHVQKEALQAFSEGAKIFIHYLTATANDVCHEARRQTISAGDVLKAVDELDFPEFIGPLEAALESFKREAAAKMAKKEESKKRKAEEDLAAIDGAPAVASEGAAPSAGAGTEDGDAPAAAATNDDTA